MLASPTMSYRAMLHSSRMALARVRSADGTSLAYDRDGAGPPLVLVHGALSDRSAFAALRPHLVDHFTVYALDRRGRGDSGDTPPYAAAREIEDLEALIGAVGGPVHLFGHSAGGLLSMRVAERGAPLCRLALYEPSLFGVGGRTPWPPEFADELRARLAAGDRAGVVRTLLGLTLGMDDAAIDRFQRGPGWARVLALAPTTVYDAELARESLFDAARFVPWTTPTLLLEGARSPSWRRAGVAALAAALPEREVVTLAGQEHIAHLIAPATVADVLVRFFLDRPRV